MTRSKSSAAKCSPIKSNADLTGITIAVTRGAVTDQQPAKVAPCARAADTTLFRNPGLNSR